MKIWTKQKKSIKQRISLLLLLFMIIGLVTIPKTTYASNQNNSVSQNENEKDNEVKRIDLQWSKNNMNYVNSDNSIKSNRHGITSAKYFNLIDNNNNLVSPKNYENETGNILRTPMLVNPLSSYTIDYRNLEKWFEPSNSNGIEPISLSETEKVWNENRGNSTNWKQSIREDSNLQYKTQDWYMFRGIVDEKAFENKGITDENRGDYEFYLAMPDGKMILGANDLISVFVDEHSTGINYATPSLNEYGNRKINFKVRDDKDSNNFVDKPITYENLSTDRYGGNDRDKHGYRWLNLGSADGWHVDLNNKDKDGKGNVVLGNVTNIINQNVYGDNKHMIDMLASEWCNEGGMTQLALYAVKKPTLNVKKIAYVHSNDKDKIKQADIKSTESNGDVILNTDNNNVPSIPANVTVYFKFKVSVENSNIKNVVVTDKNSDMGIDYKYMIGDMTKDSSRIIKDENNLKFTNKSANYNELNKEFTNTVNVTGTYFNNQLTVKDSDSVKFKTNFKPNISVKKTLVNINGKDVDYDKDKQLLVEGDKVKFKISVTNNSDMDIGGVSLKDTLKNDGEKTDWKFTSDPKDKDSNNFTLDKGKTVDFYTEWNVENTQESKGSNTAYININGCKENFPSNEVDFNIKAKEGTINVTKQVNRKFDKNKLQYSDLTQSDKDEIKDQLFTISLVDNTVDNNNDNKVQTVAIKNGQTAQFTGLKYGHSYTIKESIPMNYKLESINGNKSKSDTFTMGFDIDNSMITVTNSYSDNGWFEWYENVANKLKTASNL